MYIIFIVLLIEVVGIVRFYLIYEDLRYTFECFAIVIFLVSADFICFSGMLKAKYADPGYLIPKDQSDSDEDLELSELTKDGKAVRVID